MEFRKTTTRPKVTIEEVYPDLTPEQQQEAAYFLRRYLSVIRRIFERLEREKQEQLTASKGADTL
jgi:RIO-like serine/threonine protein kinase